MGAAQDKIARPRHVAGTHRTVLHIDLALMTSCDGACLQACDCGAKLCSMSLEGHPCQAQICEACTAASCMPASCRPRSKPSVDCTAISFRLVRAGASIWAEMRCALIASVVQASEASPRIFANRSSRFAAVSVFESWYCLQYQYQIVKRRVLQAHD